MDKMDTCRQDPSFSVGACPQACVRVYILPQAFCDFAQERLNLLKDQREAGNRQKKGNETTTDGSHHEQELTSEPLTIHALPAPFQGTVMASTIVLKCTV